MAKSPEAKRRRSLTDWLTSLAVLGDSGLALVASSVLLSVAIAYSLYVNDDNNNNNDVAYHRLGPVPPVDPPHIFVVAGTRDDDDDNARIRQAFVQDGVVAVRGLLNPALLEALDRESARLVDPTKRKRGTQFHTVVHGALFHYNNNNNNNNASTENDNDATSAFLQVALNSTVPAMAAELLQATGELTVAKKNSNNNNNNNNLRVMRDILLAKDDEAYICGWHVDDLGFWPATAEAPGINAWIALDDMEHTDHGGGFALAVGSHQASWRHQAHVATGASTTFPTTTTTTTMGYTSAADMFAQRTGSGTCNLRDAAPHLHRRMEETKRIYPVRRGDVIFHTRWLFHRTVPFARHYVAACARQQQQQKEVPLIYRRYSIRYSPGDATIPPGYGTELSVLWDDANGGRSANEVCRIDGPWYPQAWPSALASEVAGLADLVENKMPVAEERRAARKQEMKPYLKQLAHEHQQRRKQEMRPKQLADKNKQKRQGRST